MVREVLWIGREEATAAEFLAPHGYRVTCVSNARDALPQLAAGHFFAIVVEDESKALGEMTIREIAAQVRSPVAVRILLSRQGFPEKVRRSLGYDSGMCVLDLPFDLDELVSILDEFLPAELAVLK